jgi:hypothetical protein
MREIEDARLEEAARRLRMATMPDEAPADLRRHSPAAERNRGPILAELQRLLPERGLMLEIASGTGQHAAAFSAGLPGWQWQPSEFDASALPSIRAWCAGLAAGAVRRCVLDVMRPRPGPACRPRWMPIFCANLLHIAPGPAARR